MIQVCILIISYQTDLLNKLGGVFNLGESDRLYRLAEISSAAIELFEGDEDKARNWLNHPVKGLGGKRPVDMAITSAETEATIDLIGRLEHGVFS